MKRNGNTFRCPLIINVHVYLDDEALFYVRQSAINNWTFLLSAEWGYNRGAFQNIYVVHVFLQHVHIKHNQIWFRAKIQLCYRPRLINTGMPFKIDRRAWKSPSLNSAYRLKTGIPVNNEKRLSIQYNATQTPTWLLKLRSFKSSSFFGVGM